MLHCDFSVDKSPLIGIKLCLYNEPMHVQSGGVPHIFLGANQ